MNKFSKIFKTKHPIIGMIHFSPLIGYKKYPGLEKIKKKTLEEVKILNKTGVHSIMVENNYDIPHKEFVQPEVVSMMALLTQLVVDNTKLPVGINVLWNDYKSALGICAVTGACYIRVPAFVDDVKTAYGVMHKRADEVSAYKKRLGLKSVCIFADVQVKHSEMLNKKKSLSLSVSQAFRKRADAIIVTGKWTGDAPKMEDLKEVRKSAKRKPILIGSGSTPENLSSLLKYADGIIVGTSIMKNRKVNLEKLKRYLKSYKKIFDK